MAVMIDDDVFIDMLWERVNTFCSNSYSEEFWDAVFDYLKDTGWLSDSAHNSPSYIVDNIYVNGEVKTLEEIRENYSYPDVDITKMSDDELRNYLAEETNWTTMGDRFVRRLGL